MCLRYIVPPLWLACPGLVDKTPVNELMTLQSNTTLLYPQGRALVWRPIY